MAKMLQPSMSAGELSPGLQGRVDIARYAVGLKTCRNVITRPTGGGGKRTGMIYRGAVKNGAVKGRLLPFIYSTQVRYLIEVGDLYFRFWYLDATNALFRLESGAVPIEVVTPYTTADLENIRITQSADVLYLVDPDYRTRELRRLTATSFELREYENRLGPFRPVNGNEAALSAASAATGQVVVTCSEPIFKPGHVDALFFLEEKELRSIKPWEPAQRDLSIGDYRRSDGKIYRLVTKSSGGTYCVSGGVRPIHEDGRAWDGSGDTRSDGVANYSVGMEWEYVNAGFGIVKLTGYTDANTMSGLVIERVPDSCVGTAVAATTWGLVGDGSTKTFAIAGATSESVNDYTVSIDGVGVPS